MSEICFKVGDSGGSKDGDVLTILPDGWLVSGADMSAWFKDSKEPAVLASMPKYLADRFRRRVLAIIWKRDRTDTEIEKEYKLPVGGASYERSRDASDVIEAETNGWDSNWGYGDLKVHAVVRVPDLTAHEIAEFTDSARTVDHLGKPLAKKRYRVAYETALSAGKMTDIQDPEKRVDVDRISIALAKTIIVAKTVVVAKAEIA